MGRNRLSTRNQASIPKVTAQREVTISTKKKNTRRKSNSSRKKEILMKRRSTADIITNENIKGAVTSRRVTRLPGTNTTQRARAATSGREVMSTHIRVTNPPPATTTTGNMETITSRKAEKRAARNGCTIMDIQPRRRIWSLSTKERIGTSMDLSIMVEFSTLDQNSLVYFIISLALVIKLM
ncbi:uncharacterized protein LOC114242779 [Bombyx mandarina]|uniref:Uncharacterized protein LOC114242779 n=1 Tax=Bombyx mandarina TaxID=7092 RepID=A0A6J2JNE8_BOMMA|nr:uncharacterized protein LOC114242779 [Bombyx mandarina]